MLTLNDGRNELWQWDTGRKLTVDADCSQVHFSNKFFGRSVDVDVVDGTAEIPDVLLQADKDLLVWAFVGTAENGYTKISKIFKVNKRNKPADYVFTPTEQTTLGEIMERLDKIEENQDPDAIKNAVEDYLEQNPVDVPVESVNGKTGAVKLTAKDVGAISQDDLQEATNEVLAQAKASGEFDGPVGPQGPKGDTGASGKDGQDGYTPVKGVDYFDGQPGKDGSDGKDGADGYTPVKGKDYFDGKDGQDGSPGKDGSNGVSAAHSWNGTVLTVTSASGTSSADLKGATGKTAYAYAQDGGYTGTEEEFAAKLASEDVSAPADWNAAEGEPGHVLNRTHWRDVRETVLVEKTVTVSNYQWMDTSGASIPLNVGETYTVVWDGVSYEAVAKAMDYNGFDAVAVGNAGIIPTTGEENTGEPFLIITIAGVGYGVVCLTDGEHTIAISGNEYTYHTIPPEYLAGSKPFYIDLRSNENFNIVYETDVTENDIQNALASGYQVVVRRTLPQWNWLDLFFMDRRVNDGTLYFYRITGRYANNDIEDPMDYEFLQFTPNDVGGYDITPKKVELVQKSDIPTAPSALKSPYALTINGVSYDGSAAVNMTIEGGGDNIPDYVRTEAERLAKVVQARQNENTISAILSSDYHLPNAAHVYHNQILESITHAGQAMGILRNQLSIDFEAKLGDLIWDSGETQGEALANFQLVHSLVSEGNVLDRFEGNGNHDHLQSNSTPLTDSQVYANIGIYNKGCVRDSANRAGGYCYKDYEDFKLRLVLLNTSEANNGYFTLSSAQLAWLDEALSVPVEEGWGTLILSHHPLDWGGSNTSVMKKIKAASGIIANLHGHVHTFTQDVITGTEIPRLAIPNVCFYRNNEYGTNGKAENSEGIEFGTTSTYSKTAKTANDTSFCVLTLDRAAGKLYLDRYGAGIDRVEDVPTWGKKGYTNLVPTAQAMDSTDPYNGTGYKNNYRLSSSSPFESAESGYVLTGYIPYTVDDMVMPGTIYIKGGTWDAVSGCRLYFFTAAKGSMCGPYINGNGTAENNLLSTFYTMETLGDDYFRLVPVDAGGGKWKAQANAASVVDAEFFRISLAGSGENLIVTVDEPID